MGIALVGLLWLGFGVLLLSVLMAHVPIVANVMTWLANAPFVATHFTLGVCASLTALFGVVITMFYFIGTAKAVKEAVRDYELDREYYELTLKYKRKYFPGMTLSLLFYIATPSLGGATMVDMVAPYVHGVVAYLTLIVHGWICIRGQEYLLENDRLVAKVDYLVKQKEESPKQGSQAPNKE